MSDDGWVVVVGIGPGDPAMVTPNVSAELEQATDVIGYIPYVERIAGRPGLTLHASDNRVEMDRARLALELGSVGRRVVVVSSGDPGVFAMASALFEAIETGPAEWRTLDVRVLPGITAMLAAAAAVGAPLGHDFCAINLSDNLKPWALLEKRLRLAVEGDLAIALYNPRSRARPEGFGKTLTLLHDMCEPERVIVFARNVSLAEEKIAVVRLREAVAEMADMRTVVLIGSSQTRVIERQGTPFVYTPRSVPVS